MAREGKIDELFQIPEMEKQQQRAIELISEFVDVINKVKPIAIKLEGAEKTKEVIDGMKAISGATNEASATSKALNDALAKLSEMSAKAKANYDSFGNSLEDNIKKQLQYKVRLEEIKKAMKDLEQFKGLGGDAQVKMQEEIAKLTKEQLLLKQSTVDVNAAIKAQVKEMQASSGSIDEARAKLAQLRDARNSIDLTAPGGQQAKDQLNEQIDLLDEFIKKNVDAYTQQKINIGNYQGSAKIIVDALSQVESKLDTLREKQTNLQNLSNSNPIGFKLGNQADQLNQVTAEIKQLETEAKALSTVTNDPKFLNLASKAGDARTEIKGFTTTLIELERQGLGDTDFAVELRKHLAELTDQVADTKDEIKALSSDTRSFDELTSSVNLLANTYQTFVGIQALAGEQSEEVEQTIKKLVAVQAVANGLQQIGEQLTKRGTLANKAYVAVQKLWATANDASAASTVRLAAATKLLLGGLIIGGIVLLVTKLQEWSAAAEKIFSKQKALNEAINQSGDSYAKAAVEVNVLKTNIELAKKGFLDKEKVVKQYNETIGKTTGQVTSLDEAEKALVKNGDAYIKMTLYKAAANIALENAAKKAFEIAEKANKPKTTSELISGDQLESAKREAENNKEVLALKKQADDALLKGERDLANDLYKKSEALRDEIANRKVFKDDFKEQQEQLDLAKKFQEDAAKIAKDFNFNFFGDTDPDKKKDKNDQLEKDLKAQFDVYKLNKERLSALFKESAQDESLSYQQREMNLLQFIRTQQSLIADQAAFDLNNKDLSAKEKVAIEQKAIDQQIKVADEGRKILEKISKDYLDSLKRDNKEVVAVYGGTYTKIHAALTKFYEDQERLRKENEKLEEEGNQRILDAKTKLFEEIKGLAFDLLTNNIENEKNQIQEQIDLLEQKKGKEVEVVAQSLLNEQQKADQIAVIEARANAQREQLEQRKRRLEVDRAKFEKAKAIAEVVQQTAIGIISAQKYPPPLNGILAGLIAGIGALQISRIASQPLPKYAQGTEDHPGGYAVVGDGGKKEYIQTPDGDVYETPNTPTVMDIPEHSKVFKSEFDLMDAMHRQHISTTSRAGAKMPNDHYQFQNMTKSIERMEKNVVKAIKNAPQPVIQAVHPVKKWVHSNGSTEYI